MNDQQLLEIMAHADGELEASRRSDVERLLAQDAGAAALQRELVTVRELMRTHEPVGQVSDSREFYWSQIQRRMAQAEQAAGRPGPAKSNPFSWLRWLTPALGVAAVAVAVTVQQRNGFPLAGADLGPRSMTEAANPVTFTSDSDGVTIQWIN